MHLSWRRLIEYSDSGPFTPVVYYHPEGSDTFSPVEPFDPWAWGSNEAIAKKKKKAKKKKTELNYDQLLADIEAEPSRSSTDLPHGVSEAGPELDVVDQRQEQLEKPQSSSNGTAATTQASDLDGQPRVELLVSSAHLRLGSRYFKRTLTHQWKESVTYRPDGRRCMDAEGWDEDALLIVMRLLHNLDRQVPRNVNLEMLAKIAVIVDYYDCHEAVQFFATAWIDGLKDELPSTCDRDLMLWLLVSSVFEVAEVFQKMSEVAVLKSTGPLPKLDLPIRDIIIGKYSILTGFICVESSLTSFVAPWVRQN